MIVLVRRALLVAAPWALALPASAQAPSVDPTHLLDAVASPRGGTRMQLIGGTAAFLPEAAIDNGSNERRTENRLFVVLERGGEEVRRWKCQVRPAGGVFTIYSPVGSTIHHELDREGPHRLVALLDDRPLTEVSFDVALRKSGDPFDPSTTVVVDAPLLRWAQVRVVDPKGDRPTVEFALRLRGEELDLAPDERLQVQVRQGGRPVFECGTISASGLRGETAWGTFTKNPSFLASQGGGPVPFAEFVKSDGAYELVVARGDQVLRAWSYRIDGGRVVPHARSAFDHEPATEFLLPRAPRTYIGEGMMDIAWIEPVEPGAAVAAAPTATAVPAAATLALWKPAVPAPARAPKVVVTDVAARVDAHLAAGRDLVAYGTGAVRGVAYLRVGEDREVSFPGGAEVSSKVFFVCGTKLVLVKDREVLVHDTATGATVPVPAEDVYLTRAPTDFEKGRAIDADGMLVAVLCDPKKVADRRTVKVLDLSGDAPRVVVLGLPEAEAAHLVSVAVDAAGGTVVVGSDRASALFAAPVAEGAGFRTLDLSAHDGLPKDCAPIVRGGLAAIFDATGTRKLRLVDLDGGGVTTVAPLARAQRWFDFDGHTVVLAGTESNGGDHRILMGTVDAAAAPPPGSGADLGAGKVGFGQRVALAGEGLVFTSGSGAGGVGAAEFLQVTEGGEWVPVTHDGAPLPAVDAVAGEHLVAFKSGKARDVRVGYVLLGQGTVPGMLGR